jgi:hypothetical protein
MLLPHCSTSRTNHKYIAACVVRATSATVAAVIAVPATAAKPEAPTVAILAVLAVAVVLDTAVTTHTPCELNIHCNRM